MFNKIKQWIVAQVIWAEQNLTGLSGREKRDAVVRKLDDMIQLPAALEPFDGPIIGFLVDLAVAKLNTSLGHGFGSVELTGKQEKQIADAIEIPKAMAVGLKGATVKESTGEGE